MIEDIRKASSEEWDNFYRECSCSTFFHSREWAEIWKRYSNGRIEPDPRVVQFSDGVEVLLPFSLRSGQLMGRRYVSSPAGTYGGWLYKTESMLTKKHFLALRDFLCNLNITMRQNPYDGIVVSYGDKLGWSRKDFTQVIDYSVGLDSIRETLRKNQVYRQFEQGREAGLTLRKTDDRHYIVRYFEIYQACRERWGDDASNDYDQRLFEQFDLSSSDVDFWIVKESDTVICAGPFLRKDRFHVVSWLTLADPGRLNVKPYEFIYYSLIEHYGEKGFRYFDFNPSGGHEGVIRFKEKFGTQRLTTNVLRNRTSLVKGVDQIRSYASRAKSFIDDM